MLQLQPYLQGHTGESSVPGVISQSVGNSTVTILPVRSNKEASILRHILGGRMTGWVQRTSHPQKNLIFQNLYTITFYLTPIDII